VAWPVCCAPPTAIGAEEMQAGGAQAGLSRVQLARAAQCRPVHAARDVTAGVVVCVQAMAVEGLAGVRQPW